MAAKVFKDKYGFNSTNNDGERNDSSLNDHLKRVKRQSLPDTMYIVQIYMVVDFYLYET